MYHVSAQGIDERMINAHYYYYLGLSVWNSLSLNIRNAAIIIISGPL